MAELLEVGGGGGGGGSISPIQNFVFVGKNGVDAPTQDGSIAKPYLTIAYALSQIPTVGPIAPSPTNRWCVFVAAGRYNEGTITLKPDVMIFGSHFMATRIAAAAWDINSALWTGAGDHRTGIQNAAISGTMVLDWNAIGSNEGKAYFRNVWLQSNVTSISHGPIQQVFLDTCLTFGVVTCRGAQFITENCNFQNAVVFNPGPTLPASVWLDTCSAFQAGTTIDLTGQGGEGYQFFRYGSGDAGPTTLKGTFTISVTPGSLPKLANLTKDPTVTLDLLGDAISMGYTPNVLADWEHHHGWASGDPRRQRHRHPERGAHQRLVAQRLERLTEDGRPGRSTSARPLASSPSRSTPRGAKLSSGAVV